MENVPSTEKERERKKLSKNTVKNMKDALSKMTILDLTFALCNNYASDETNFVNSQNLCVF